MARISYFEIEQAIVDQIAADPDVAAFGAQVSLEEAVSFGRGDKVFVYLEKREAPEEEQLISAGRRVVMHCHYSIWCFVYGAPLANAIARRDELLRLVEQAIMRNRRFGREDIGTSWIAGGEFHTAENDPGFNVGAEIELVVKTSAIN